MPLVLTCSVRQFLLLHLLPIVTECVPHHLPFFDHRRFWTVKHLQSFCCILAWNNPRVISCVSEIRHAHLTSKASLFSADQKRRAQKFSWTLMTWQQRARQRFGAQFQVVGFLWWRRKTVSRWRPDRFFGGCFVLEKFWGGLGGDWLNLTLSAVWLQLSGGDPNLQLFNAPQKFPFKFCFSALQTRQALQVTFLGNGMWMLEENFFANQVLLVCLSFSQTAAPRNHKPSVVKSLISYVCFRVFPFRQVNFSNYFLENCKSESGPNFFPVDFVSRLSKSKDVTYSTGRALQVHRSSRCRALK